MNEIKVSFDNQGYQSKPSDKEAAMINKRIGRNIKVLSSASSIRSFMLEVGQHGHTFSPATFSNGEKKNEYFAQMQLLVLDFDGTISYESVCERAEQYELPILSAYDTFSSDDHNRFRIIFLNDVSITNIMAAKIYKNALMTIFPEADRSDHDISKMYYGGKELLYFDDSLPRVNIESIIRNMSCYLKDKYGSTHYKRYIKQFANKNGIRLNKKGLLDISVTNNSTENMSTLDLGKNSPNAIIIYKDNGDILPKSYYQIYLEEHGTPCSASKKNHKNHSEYRSKMMKDINQKCQLFREFESGIRRLHHEELFGISTNLIHIETGINTLKDIISRYPQFYDESKQNKWNYYLPYIKDQQYGPMECNMFCPHKDTCKHRVSILSTAKLKRGTMERIPNYEETYYPIEDVQRDLARKLEQAASAEDKMWHIIKAQTAAGKTEAYLNLMKSSDKRFLIVVPTNKLKWDVKSRAEKLGIDLMVSPSLDEIKDEMPDYIWNYIKFLRDTGQHSKVYSFIEKMVLEENVVCLKKYLKKLREFENYVGNTITTHRKFLSMNKNIIKKYDVVIIDEDIILSSIVPDQCEIPISVLKKILKRIEKVEMYSGRKDTYAQLSKKIRQLFRKIKKDSLFKLFGFEWEDEEWNNDEKENGDDILGLADIPSFCLAEHFMYRQASKEKNLSEDSIVFLKPYKFKNIKHIMVSATVDKDICEYCFGKQNVKFYECKQAHYVGTLNQYYDKTMSRQCIDEDTSILKKISDWSGFDHMITFKKYAVDDMYFGNAIGCDYLKGQDIDVVGTPYQVDFLYKLFPFSLGLDIDGDATMKSCEVSHNGYTFYFTTFGAEHDILRRFHLWMIESELEQAVGRARLLRCNCTVNLFSNFPLRQAVMKKSEYDDN